MYDVRYVFQSAFVMRKGNTQTWSMAQEARRPLSSCISSSADGSTESSCLQLDWIDLIQGFAKGVPCMMPNTSPHTSHRTCDDDAVDAPPPIPPPVPTPATPPEAARRTASWCASAAAAPADDSPSVKEAGAVMEVVVVASASAVDSSPAMTTSLVWCGVVRLRP